MANNKLQIKRTTVSGRTPNTTNSGNSQYISTGELALNLADSKLFTSDGTNLIDLTPTGGSSSLTVRSTNGNGGAVNTTVSGVTGINFDDSTGLHVTSQGSGNVFVSLGSGYKYITVSGQTTITAVGEDTLNVANGQGIVLTTSNTAPKTLTIASTGYVNVDAQYTFSNTVTFSSTVSANINGNANNASYLGGTAAANYVQNSSAYTISGIHTHSANIIMSNGNVIVANGSFGANGYVLTSNGTSMYWRAASSGGGSSVTVSDTAPSSPASGDLWYYTGTSELFIYYNDGNSSQWVTTAPADNVPSALSAVSLTLSGNATFSANITISNTRISANGSTGTAGQFLTSSGTGANVYWSTPTPGVTTGKSIAMAIVFGG
jgi:hypothetical protein